MEYANVEMNLFRQKIIDYYGSATELFPMATAEVIRVEQMSDIEVIQIIL